MARRLPRREVGGPVVTAPRIDFPCGLQGTGEYGLTGCRIDEGKLLRMVCACAANKRLFRRARLIADLIDQHVQLSETRRGECGKRTKYQRLPPDLFDYPASTR